MTEREWVRLNHENELVKQICKMNDEQCQRFIKIMTAYKAAEAAGEKNIDIEALAESID